MSMSRPRAAGILALTLAAALTLTACSGEDGSTDPGAQEQTAQQTPAEDAPDDAATSQGGASDEPGDDAGEAESLAESGVDLVTLGEPAATFEKEVTISGDNDAVLVVDVYPLQRDGDLLTLVAGVRLDARSGGGNLRSLLGEGSPVRPILIDTENLRTHSVVQAGSAYLTTDTLMTRVQAGQTRYYHAFYAAPPEDVTSMTVTFDGVPALPNVPIR